MRTTLDLPEDLHELARQLAHQQRTSMSAVLTQLIRNGLDRSSDAQLDGARSSRGMPTVSIGRTVTDEDVRSLDDDA